MCFYHILQVINDSKFLAMQANKSIFSTSNDIKRTHSNDCLYFQNYYNTTKLNATP